MLHHMLHCGIVILFGTIVNKGRTLAGGQDAGLKVKELAAIVTGSRLARDPRAGITCD